MIRWALVPFGAGVGLLGAFVLTSLLTTGFAQWCPGGHVDGGVCAARWVARFPFVFGGASAAILGVGIGSLLAPTRRRAVAWTLYGLGLIFALPFASHEMFVALGSAAVAGMGTAVLLHGIYGRD